MIRVSFGMQVAKTLTYFSCANFHFLLHYVITIHKHYGETQVQHVFGMSR